MAPDAIFLEVYLVMGVFDGNTIKKKATTQAGCEELREAITKAVTSCVCETPGADSINGQALPKTEEAFLERRLGLGPGEKILFSNKDGYLKFFGHFETFAKRCSCEMGQRATISLAGAREREHQAQQSAQQSVLPVQPAQPVKPVLPAQPDTLAPWPYETTTIYKNGSNESQESKNAWRPMCPPPNYRSGTLPSHWQHLAQYAGPTARPHTLSDGYLWEYVFGQTLAGGSLAGAPGYATVQQLNRTFHVPHGRSPGEIPIVVAFDVEKSAQTFEWRGEGAPDGGSMKALVPTQLGFTYFDPLQVATPNLTARRKGEKNWQIPSGQPMPPGDRGKIWRDCGHLETHHFCLEVEAQMYHTEGKIPGWVKAKGMYSDSGAFSFFDIKPLEMKALKGRVLDFLNKLRSMGRKKGDKWYRPLIFVVWAPTMEISALRFLGLHDFIPGGIHDPSRGATEGWIRWLDLQTHPTVKRKTETMQGPGQLRSLTNYVLDLGLHTEEQMRAYAHNAGMDVSGSLTYLFSE